MSLSLLTNLGRFFQKGLVCWQVAHFDNLLPCGSPGELFLQFFHLWAFCRTIGEQAKLLDDARSCVRTISDLFTPILQAQRRKFCDYCDRLIFSEPLIYGRRGEELLWRKGFYEVIYTAKKLKKAEFSCEEIGSIQSHINSGWTF